MNNTLKLWALMAILATVALTSFTVQAILDDGPISIEPAKITGNIVAKATETGEPGLISTVSKAAEWLMDG